MKKYPQVNINLELLKKNTEIIVNKCSEKNINVIAVTKVFCADPKIAQAILDGGVNMVADSRIENLKKMKNLNCKKTLLRIPGFSEVERVVKYADYSQNSEIEVIKKLGEEAVKENKIHNVILMVDLGDLREGFWDEDVLEAAEEVVKIPGINLAGISTNLTCYGAVIPDEINLGKLINLRDKIEKNLNIKLEIVSGGNSSSYYLVENGKIPEGINQLRIGESIARGEETAYSQKIEGCSDEVFTLKCEIVEIKEKPSIPIGNIGVDAFGNKPVYEDRGVIKRAIIAIGKQDVIIDGMYPYDENINILGASSDHTILDVTKSKKSYKVGDIVEFKLSYGGILSTMTSSYVEKYYI